MFFTSEKSVKRHIKTSVNSGCRMFCATVLKLQGNLESHLSKIFLMKYKCLDLLPLSKSERNWKCPEARLQYANFILPGQIVALYLTEVI